MTNIIHIMTALDQVMEDVAWLGANGEIDSLKERLSGDDATSIDMLNRDALVGAYVALQIKCDNFEPAAEGLTDADLAIRVKAMVFSEAKKILDAMAVDTKSVKAA